VLVEGTPFGRYRLVSLLGRGGMGEVWRAYDTGTDRTVALKVLPAQFAKDPIYEERFRREAQAAARLHNPHIVPIHDYGEIDGRLFVDMVLIDGRDLAAEIANRPLAPARAVTTIEQIARALHAAHKAGLVHRDVKPSNILLDEDGYAYLIDFGIARAATDPGLTGTGTTIGTWAYMSPERFTSDQVDTRGDVYALACVLYETLTGTKPYPGESLERQFHGHLTTAPPRPSANRPDIPVALDTVIAKGMAKKPEHRYDSANDLAAAARAALTQTVADVPASAPGPSGSSRAPTARGANSPWAPRSGSVARPTPPVLSSKPARVAAQPKWPSSSARFAGPAQSEWSSRPPRAVGPAPSRWPLRPAQVRGPAPSVPSPSVVGYPLPQQRPPEASLRAKVAAIATRRRFALVATCIFLLVVATIATIAVSRWPLTPEPAPRPTNSDSPTPTGIPLTFRTASEGFVVIPTCRIDANPR
jgi:serine/threonine protein kinase, bacterial